MKLQPYEGFEFDIKSKASSCDLDFLLRRVIVWKIEVYLSEPRVLIFTLLYFLVFVLIMIIIYKLSGSLDNLGHGPGPDLSLRESGPVAMSKTDCIWTRNIMYRRILFKGRSRYLPSFKVMSSSRSV